MLDHACMFCWQVHSGLSCLSQLTKLTSLELDATAISDSTMPALESLCQMQTLSISYTGVSHEGQLSIQACAIYILTWLQLALICRKALGL